MMDRLANEQLKHAPGMQALRAQITERAVHLLEKLASQNPTESGLAIPNRVWAHAAGTTPPSYWEA